MLGIFLSFVNGMVIASARNINGRLSVDVGIFKASFWNHLVGFLGLLLVVLAFNGASFSDWIGKIPLPGLAGGIFGACFVALNSLAFVRLGATRAILLVIAGQIISGIIIDVIHGRFVTNIFTVLGIMCIGWGVFLAKTRK